MGCRSGRVWKRQNFNSFLFFVSWINRPLLFFDDRPLYSSPPPPRVSSRVDHLGNLMRELSKRKTVKLLNCLYKFRRPSCLKSALNRNFSPYPLLLIPLPFHPTLFSFCSCIFCFGRGRYERLKQDRLQSRFKHRYYTNERR